MVPFGYGSNVHNSFYKVGDMVELHLILLFMIAAAIIAVEVKDLLSGVVAIGAVGIGLCMAFLTLKAPDLAIIQLVVEILSLIILVRATIRKDIPFSVSGRWVFNTIGTLCFMAAFLSASYIALKNIPPLGNAAMKVSKFYIDNSLTKTGSENVVSAIIVNFRAYDTLGEVAILFTAIVGVLAIARSVGKARER
jgi:multicomponent Na+:H+ antiporter subunit B